MYCWLRLERLVWIVRSVLKSDDFVAFRVFVAVFSRSDVFVVASW
jgi:hypothetical protein